MKMERSGCASDCFLFNDTATTEVYTLSLHDALPIFPAAARPLERTRGIPCGQADRNGAADRKSTRLTSSHITISYAVFCLKKKKNKKEVCGDSKTRTQRTHGALAFEIG